MTGRRPAGRDRGSFTAEMAAGLPALVLLLLVGLTAVNAVSTRAACLDAARE
ncbi:mucin-associated surface protein, partial [Verrucosispora sp. SN26_14.1]